ARGNPLNPPPVSLTLQGQINGPTTITSYTGYVTADYYTVTSALWESAIIPANTAQTIDLTSGPSTATISLAAYPATVHITDNNNNPVSGANITITFLNGTITSKTFTSDSTGNVHLGDIPCSTGGARCSAASYGLTVNYHNQEYGPYSPDATATSTYAVQVNSGSTNTTTTTAVVLLVIFGIAFLLILLAIRVRKPAAPPTI
ncbi:Ig-like domain-containing protein, partial [Candidatus Bathyarchaeota archaeon]|nr:Ig-like domain-containing protein [Candidatus Bathyarchaeota archaeon]